MKKLLCILTAMMICALSASCSLKPPSEIAPDPVEASPELNVHFIDVGQGDCTLLESEGEFVLIDAGEFDYGEKALGYIRQLGAESIKYVIATHPHYDHIGGIRTVINSVETENFITSETDCDTISWTKLLTAVDKLDINYIDACAGDTYSFGSAAFTVMGPLSDDYEGYNGYSVAVKAVCGDISFLLMGDAEKVNEYEMLDADEDVKADVLKCGHHGSSTSTSSRFLKAVDPAFAVISCGQNNEYGHPHTETIERLELLGCTYYTTADSGTIIASTDGSRLSLAPAGEAPGYTYSAGSSVNDPSALSFIGNKNSGYFHDPVCDGAKSMNPSNRVVIDSREQALSMGFEPCPSCKP